MDAPTPCDIAHEMRRLESVVLADDLAAERYRDLGRLLMQTEGTTPLDALGFLNIAVVLVVSLQSRLAETGETAALHGSIATAGGYLARAIQTLETATGTPPASQYQ